MATIGVPGLGCVCALILIPNILSLLAVCSGHPLEPPEDPSGALGRRLCTLNFTSLPKQSAALPDDMLELYQYLVSTLATTPSASTVRIFQDQGFSSCPTVAGSIRKHQLLFNMSLPHPETIVAAELYLHGMVQQDQLLYPGLGRRVTVFEIQENHPEKKEDGGGRGELLRELSELASQHIDTIDNIWKTFNLTVVVRRWHMKSAPQRLEVHIASTNGSQKTDRMKSGGKTRKMGSDGKADTKRALDKLHKPLMIIFSHDVSRQDHEGQRNLNVMTRHGDEQDNLDVSSSSLQGKAKGGSNQDIQKHSNPIYDPKMKVRRSLSDSLCQRTSLYVKFKDIGWDKWILAPAGYEAYKCSGMCSFPLTSHVNPTKHAMVQTLLNLVSPQKVEKACCVPTKLDGIPVLYRDESGEIIYEKDYENMVVKECGCR